MVDSDTDSAALAGEIAKRQQRLHVVEQREGREAAEGERRGHPPESRIGP
jgi:hypothetical protein